MKFITKHNKDSKFDEDILRALECFKLLETIENLKTFEQQMESLKCNYSHDRDLEGVVDRASAMGFIEKKKLKIVYEVEDSAEFTEFKDGLKKKYLSKKKPCCQCGLL